MSSDNYYLDNQNLKTKHYLDNLKHWTDEKKIKINSSKTNNMIANFCTSAQFQVRFDNNGELLERVHKTKLLGVILSDDLKLTSNTESHVKRLYTRMQILRNLAKF